MQIYLNTYGTYLHVKDDMFEIRVPVKDAEPEKNILRLIKSALLSFLLLPL